MVFTGEAVWRWKMLLPSADRLYDTFWRQSARWLSTAAPERIALSLPLGIAPGEPARVGVTVRDASFAPVRDATVSLKVAPPGGSPRDLQPSLTDAAAGRFTAAFRPEQGGVHRITAEVRRGGTVLGAAEGFALVGGADDELADPRLNEDVLRRVAEASGGRLLTAADLPSFSGLFADRAGRSGPPAQRDLWHSVWSFAAIVFLLSLEWGLRRTWGLR
jgi:hypothetical protein